MSPFFSIQKVTAEAAFFCYLPINVSVIVEFTAGGCVFLTTASPYKGANLSCARRSQMMSCFLYFSLLSSCCRKAGLEVSSMQEQSRSCLPWPGWGCAGLVLWQQTYDRTIAV